jgi:hypothetical protein
MRYAVCLIASFFGLPAEPTANQFEATQNERVAQYRAVLSTIAADPVLSRQERTHDLPAAVREVIEAWADDRAA